MHVLLWTSLLASHASAVTQGYLGISCTGFIRVTFPTIPFTPNVCLRGLFTRSIFTDDLDPNEFLTAFRPNSQNPYCGAALCSIVVPEVCCSVNQLKIRAVMFFQVPPETTAVIAMQEDTLEESNGACNDANSRDVWDIGAYLGVEVSEGKYINVPNTTSKPPTQQEIYNALIAAGLDKSDANELAARAYKALNEKDDDEDSALPKRLEDL